MSTTFIKKAHRAMDYEETCVLTANEGVRRCR